MLLSLLLTGCLIASALIVSAVGVTVVAIDSDDEEKEVLLCIQEKLIDVNNYRLLLMSYHQDALLLGQVENTVLKEKVVEFAQTCQQYEFFYHNLEVDLLSNKKEMSKDSVITHKIKQCVTDIEGMNESDINLTTEKSIVYLLGRLETDNEEKVLHCIQNITGVEGIVNYIKRRE